MAKLRGLIQSVKKLEWLLLIAAVAALILQSGGGLFKGTEQTALEKRVQAALKQISGVGNVYVMFKEDARGTPEGALIVAEGAEEIRTRLRIQYAVETLLSLDAQKIEIMEFDRE